MLKYQISLRQTPDPYLYVNKEIIYLQTLDLKKPINTIETERLYNLGKTDIEIADELDVHAYIVVRWRKTTNRMPNKI